MITFHRVSFFVGILHLFSYVLAHPFTVLTGSSQFLITTFGLLQCLRFSSWLSATLSCLFSMFLVLSDAVHRAPDVPRCVTAYQRALSPVQQVKWGSGGITSTGFALLERHTDSGPPLFHGWGFSGLFLERFGGGFLSPGNWETQTCSQELGPAVQGSVQTGVRPANVLGRAGLCARQALLPQVRCVAASGSGRLTLYRWAGGLHVSTCTELTLVLLSLIVPPSPWTTAVLLLPRPAFARPPAPWRLPASRQPHPVPASRSLSGRCSGLRSWAAFSAHEGLCPARSALSLQQDWKMSSENSRPYSNGSLRWKSLSYSSLSQFWLHL